MINVVVPIVNDNKEFIDKFGIPKNLVMVGNKPLIQNVIESFIEIFSIDNNVIFIIDYNESKNFQTELLIKQILPFAKFAYAHGITSGAVLSLLLSIELIHHDKPLLIIGGDQTVNLDLNSILFSFLNSKSNHLITFKSSNKLLLSHPYSFARLNNNFIYFIEEKKSISNIALTGIYFFISAVDFFNKAQEYILKFPEQDIYFISQVVNLMIESGLKFLNHSIMESEYNKFFKAKLIEGKYL